ncbi:MAG: hypothetical protein KGN36_13845 [Acidobacteriota bacterium]|nr:hypothetical protein [Acidobacteriota bacterium]
MRYLFAVLLLPALCTAALLPSSIGEFQKGAAVPLSATDKAVWDEYGLKTAESAVYAKGKEKFTLSTWMLNDSTGAMAVFFWQRPAKATVSPAAPLAAETSDSLLLLYGNYVIFFNGRHPESAEISAVTGNLRNVDSTVLPPLADDLPVENLVPNTERYITGPSSLDRFYPGIPPAVAAFRYGAEAATGMYRSPKGDIELAIFNYPTHLIARQREPEFVQIPGAMVKRSGPLVAVVLKPADADAAERLLGKVRYQATVTVDEYVPTQRDNIGNLVVNAFILIGILLAFSLVSGFAVGGWRLLRRRGKGGEELETFLALHIDRH